MASAGRILIIPKGDYDANSTYDNLDLVKHKGTSWLAKKESKGIEPNEANSEYWQDVFEPNIANNLTTEEEGYALDARQGKVLNDRLIVLEDKTSKNYNGTIVSDSKNTVIENYNNMPVGISTCILTQGSQCFALIGKTSNLYGTAIIIGYELTSLEYGRLANGIWYWQNVTTTESA